MLPRVLGTSLNALVRVSADRMVGSRKNRSTLALVTRPSALARDDQELPDDDDEDSDGEELWP